MDNAKTTELTFPVLCLSQDRSISVAESPEGLNRCNALAFFKNRYFDDLLIFDSHAERFRVVRVEATPPLAGVRKWLTRALNRRLTVHLELRREAPRSIEEAKRQVVIWIEKAADVWEETRDLSEWKQVVEGARDMRQLIRLFR